MDEKHVFTEPLPGTACHIIAYFVAGIQQLINMSICFKLSCAGRNKYRNLALLVGRVSKIETINYAHESRGTQIRKRLCWRCPAKTEKYRPDFSSERAPHINKPETVEKK
jgi:hypothetical protein